MINPKTSARTYFHVQIHPDEWLQNQALVVTLLVALTGFAAILRLYKLGQWSFWIDEVYNINYARDLWQHFNINASPSLMLISAFLRQVRVNEFNARFIPAIIGILTIPLFYYPIRKMFNPATALLAVLLISLSPWHLTWSQNSRFYASLMLFYGLAMFTFFFAMESDKLLLYLLSAVFFGIALQEKKTAGFLAIAVAGYLASLPALHFELPKGLNRRNLIIMIVPVVLLVGLDVASYAILGHDLFLSGFIEYIVGYHQNAMRLLLSIIYDMGLPLFLVALVGGAFLLSKRSRAGLFLVINAVLPVILLVAISPFTQAFSRYVLVTFPAWATLAAVAAVELFTQVTKDGRLLAFAVLAVLLAEPLSQDVLYFTYQNGNRPDWKGAFSVVAQGLQPGDRVVTTRRPIATYYLDRPVEWTQGLNPKDFISAGSRAWFVIDNETGFVSPKLASWLADQVRLVSVKDVSIPGKTMQMRVYLYEPPPAQ